jgi:hypothetical protein
MKNQPSVSRNDEGRLEGDTKARTTGVSAKPNRFALFAPTLCFCKPHMADASDAQRCFCCFRGKCCNKRRGCVSCTVTLQDELEFTSTGPPPPIMPITEAQRVAGYQPPTFTPPVSVPAPDIFQ